MLTTGEKRTMTEEEVLEEELREVQAMSPAEFQAYGRRAVLECLNLLMDQVDHLTKEMAQLKGTRPPELGDGPAIPLMRYMAVWHHGQGYVPGDVVTWNGQLWHCGSSTKEQPGRTAQWQMMHKDFERERNRNRERNRRP